MDSGPATGIGDKSCHPNGIHAAHLEDSPAAASTRRKRIVNDKRHVAQVTLRQSTVLGLVLLPLFTTGCLFVGGTEWTEFEEAKRIPVKFLSVGAAHDFHEGLRRSDREAYTDARGFVMPFLVARGGKFYHETAHYNAEVRLADVNRDSDITEEEAQAYLTYVERVVAGEDDR